MKLTLQFTDGHIVRALNGAPILARARNDHTLIRFNAAYRIDPAQNAYEAFALIPPGLDLHKLRSVTFLMNENQVTIRGRFMSPQEKQRIAAST